ncbi:hypothetical protein IPN35_05820 [Candidatus Peregrinibacteria bacterium]|nr:MAG: hypothetical protein IPN35_05820 [Candidatus Peregrinibacteria bacterium]
MYQFTKSIGFQIRNASLQNLLPDFSEKKGEEIFKECSRQFETLIENFENAHIQKWIENRRPKKDKNTSDLDLFISEKEWDLFLIDREEWKRQLSYFSSKKAMEEERKKK